MPAIGSILKVAPATYVNQFNYALTGTTTTFTNTTITLTGGSNTNDAYVGYAVCYVNQVNPEFNRTITAYDGATKVATLSGADWGGNPPVAGTTVWGICNDYPVDRRFQWIKDGVDINGAIGGSFTPYEAGSYQVRETAFFPATSGLTTVTTSAAVTITGTRDAALVYSDNLVWQGCFYAPDLYPNWNFVYGTALAYNPAGNGGAGSLFAAAAPLNIPAQPPCVGEMSIPTPSTNPASTPVATLLNTTGLVDPVEGQLNTSGIVGGGATIISGLLVDGGKLIVAASNKYTSSTSASWFWRRPLNLLTTGQVEGPFAVTDTAFRNNPRCYAGYMASVPVSLQTKLGGTVIAGLAAESIISNTSDGPSLSSFNPSDFTSAATNVKRGTFVAASSNTMNLSSGPSMSGTTGAYNNNWLTSADGVSSARVISGYDGGSKVATIGGTWYTTPTSGDWVMVPQIAAKAMAMYLQNEMQPGQPYPYIWDWTSSPLGGYAIPNGTRSVLVFGVGGNNYYMYSATNQVRGGVKCYDPAGESTGEHNYPYYYRCWAYDANELEQARLGNINPGNVKPYAVWNYQLPIFNTGIGGVAYDPANKRIFMVSGSGRMLVHVFTVTNATAP